MAIRSQPGFQHVATSWSGLVVLPATGGRLFRTGGWHSLTLLLLSLLGLLAASVPPAHAYYDDVHYALTYYVARQVGYTPEQAYRIASANVSVDYSYPTEPVQAGIQSIVGMPGTQEPRLRFHAFRDENRFKNAVGDGKDGAAADDVIRQRRVELWTQAIDARNPGVFLHFYQDEVPHSRYGSQWGHWGVVYEKDIETAQRHRLALGGSTDWLDFRAEESNLALARNTFNVLASFLKRVSPSQQARSFDPNSVMNLLRALRAANVAPRPLAGKSLEVFTDLKAGSSLYGASTDIIGFLANKADLSVTETQDIRKHLDGPNLQTAIQPVNQTMARLRMSADGGASSETIPNEPRRYAFDRWGSLKEKIQRDKWVLTGTLKVEVRRELMSGEEIPVPRAQVAVFTTKTRPEDREYRLGQPRSVTRAGQPVMFENLPVGWVIIEATTPNQPPVREKFFLDGQVNQTFITLKAEKPPTEVSEKFLQDVVVRSRQITITVWDTACEDGDRITVRVNGVAVFENHPLLNRKESRTVTLPSDDNTIEVFANNGGTDCPPGQTPLDKTINSGAIAISGAVSGGNQDWQIRQRTGTTARLTVDPTRATGTTAPPQLPGFLQPSARPSTAASPSASGGSPTGTANTPPKLPGFLAGETASSAKPPVASPLAAPDPWTNPLIQAHIDEWLRTAVPTSAKPGESWRFSDWGVVLAPGARTAGPPDHPAGWTRHQTVWSIRTKLDSLNACTLGEFVDRRVGGRGLEGCAKPVASVAAKPPAASSAAGGSGSTGARAALPAPAAPSKVEPAPRGDRETVADFTGYWNCASRPTDNRRAASIRAQPWSGAVQITRTGGNNFLLKSEQIQLPSSYATGNRIGFAVAQDFGGARDNLQVFSGYVSIKIDLTLTNGALSGAARVEESGDSASSSLHCTRGQPGQRAPLGVGKK
jgi:hypothetical protein